jgi:hypothetical protein
MSKVTLHHSNGTPFTVDSDNTKFLFPSVDDTETSVRLVFGDRSTRIRESTLDIKDLFPNNILLSRSLGGGNLSVPLSSTILLLSEDKSQASVLSGDRTIAIEGDIRSIRAQFRAHGNTELERPTGRGWVSVPVDNSLQFSADGQSVAVAGGRRTIELSQSEQDRYLQNKEAPAVASM